MDIEKTKKLAKIKIEAEDITKQVRVNREKRGTSGPGDFTIKFNPPLKLDPEIKYKLALDRLSMSTYSWYNIRSDYGNNTLKYTHDGSTWQTITFTDGMCSYSDINA